LSQRNIARWMEKSFKGRLDVSSKDVTVSLANVKSMRHMRHKRLLHTCDTPVLHLERLDELEKDGLIYPPRNIMFPLHR
jgi:hypothetical protein